MNIDNKVINDFNEEIDEAEAEVAASSKGKAKSKSKANSKPICPSCKRSLKGKP